jgi:hypothetical protein
MKGIFKILPFLLTLAGCSKDSAPQTKFGEISIATNNEECLIYPAMLGLFTAELPEGQRKPKVTVSIDCERSSGQTLDIQVGVEMFVPRMSEPDLRFYGQAESHAGGDLSRFELMHLLGGLIAQASQIAATKYRIETDDNEVIKVLTNFSDVPSDVLLTGITAAGERKIQKARPLLFRLFTLGDPEIIETSAWALFLYQDQEIIKVIGEKAINETHPDLWLKLLCLAGAAEIESISDAARRALSLVADQHPDFVYRKAAEKLASGCYDKEIERYGFGHDDSLMMRVELFVWFVRMSELWKLPEFSTPSGGIELIDGTKQDEDRKRKLPRKKKK